MFLENNELYSIYKRLYISDETINMPWINKVEERNEYENLINVCLDKSCWLLMNLYLDK